MVMWIGLLIGVVLGAAVGGLPGAIVMGFFGWLVGVIINANKRGESKPVEQKTPNQLSLQSRVARLEITVEQLQKRLVQLEGGEVVAPAPVVEVPVELGPGIGVKQFLGVEPASYFVACLPVLLVRSPIVG